MDEPETTWRLMPARGVQDVRTMQEASVVVGSCRHERYEKGSHFAAPLAGTHMALLEVCSGCGSAPMPALRRVWES